MDMDILFIKILYMSLSGGSDSEESAYSGRDPCLIHGSGRSPGEEKWQSTPEFLPGKSHGQMSLADCSLWLQRVKYN